MTDQPGTPRRRSRRRATSAQGVPPPRPAGSPAEPSAAAPKQSAPSQAPAEQARGKPAVKSTPSRGRPNRDAGMRDLVGSVHSQLGVSAALRGRDLNRPTEDDLAEAERNVEVVRRNWTPQPEDRSRA